MIKDNINYRKKRKELIEERLKPYCDKHEDKNDFFLFYKDLNDIRLILKALDKLGYKWGEEYNLLDYDKLEKYYSDSMKASGSFCIVICEFLNRNNIIQYYPTFTESERYKNQFGKVSNTPAREIVRVLRQIYVELRDCTDIK